jgi:voltage-dependent calcium channel L type alpha-1F
MIRCFTGENWEQVMLSSLETTDCHDNATNIVNGTTYCGSDFAYIFYPSFLFISSIVVLNLFVTIIIDNFDYFNQDQANFGPYDLVEFFPLWAKLDDDNT